MAPNAKSAFSQTLANELYDLFTVVYDRLEERQRAKGEVDTQVLVKKWRKSMEDVAEWRSSVLRDIVKHLKHVRRDIEELYLKAWDEHVRKLAPSLPDDLAVNVCSLSSFIRVAAQFYANAIAEKPSLFNHQKTLPVDQFEQNRQTLRSVGLASIESAFAHRTPVDTLKPFMPKKQPKAPAPAPVPKEEDVKPEDSVSQVAFKAHAEPKPEPVKEPESAKHRSRSQVAPLFEEVVVEEEEDEGDDSDSDDAWDAVKGSHSVAW